MSPDSEHDKKGYYKKERSEHKLQVNIEEDDTRIYVDIGNGGHVRWIAFVLT